MHHFFLFTGGDGELGAEAHRGLCTSGIEAQSKMWG